MQFLDGTKMSVCKDKILLLRAGRGGILAGVRAGGGGWTSPASALSR